MKGKEAIIDKIISDARKIANTTSEEGSAKAQELINAAENDAKLYRKKNREESELERADIIRRRIANANLAVKKLVLAAKQEVIGRVFSESVQAIIKDKSYPDYLKSLLKFASDGDTVIVSKNDKKVLTKKYVDDYAKASGIKLSYSADGEFSGGLILSGIGSDKNLTVEAEVDAARSEVEPVVAEMIFGETR